MRSLAPGNRQYAHEHTFHTATHINPSDVQKKSKDPSGTHSPHHLITSSPRHLVSSSPNFRPQVVLTRMCERSVRMEPPPPLPQWFNYAHLAQRTLHPKMFTFPYYRQRTFSFSIRLKCLCVAQRRDDTFAHSFLSCKLFRLLCSLRGGVRDVRLVCSTRTFVVSHYSVNLVESH